MTPTVRDRDSSVYGARSQRVADELECISSALRSGGIMAPVNPEISGIVEGVHRSAAHEFTKSTFASVELIAGLGVAGDAHCGMKVRHRSRVAADPGRPNLRQVHLIAGELHDELRGLGFTVGPGDMGENITTRGIDLLALPTGTLLRFDDTAMIAVTGLRNPCKQLDHFQAGLMSAVLGRTPDGELVRRAGVMGIVVLGGVVSKGDTISASVPPGPPAPLQPV